MATLMYRLGRFSFRRRLLTLVVWVILLALFGFGAARLSGPTSDALSIPGTESWRAMDVLAEKFGGGSKAASARVVFTASGDTTLTGTDQRAAVQAMITELRKAPQVTAVADPYQAGTIAPGGKTAYASVTYSVAAGDVGAPSREALFAAGDAARQAGLFPAADPPARPPRSSCTTSAPGRRTSPRPPVARSWPSPAGPRSTSTWRRRPTTPCCPISPSWSAARSSC